jgi:hypothetical protein
MCAFRLSKAPIIRRGGGGPVGSGGLHRMLLVFLRPSLFLFSCTRAKGAGIALHAPYGRDTFRKYGSAGTASTFTYRYGSARFPDPDRAPLAGINTGSYRSHTGPRADSYSRPRIMLPAQENQLLFTSFSFDHTGRPVRRTTRGCLVDKSPLSCLAYEGKHRCMKCAWQSVAHHRTLSVSLVRSQLLQTK